MNNTYYLKERDGAAFIHLCFYSASLVAQMVKNLPANAGDLGLIPALGRSPGGGPGNPLQYSCLKNPQGQRSLVGSSPWCHRVRHNRVTKHSRPHTT